MSRAGNTPRQWAWLDTPWLEALPLLCLQLCLHLGTTAEGIHKDRGYWYLSPSYFLISEPHWIEKKSLQATIAVTQRFYAMEK